MTFPLTIVNFNHFFIQPAPAVILSLPRAVIKSITIPLLVIIDGKLVKTMMFTINGTLNHGV